VIIKRRYYANRVDSTLPATNDLLSPSTIGAKRAITLTVESVAKENESLVSSMLQDFDIGDEVFVGLYLCAHDAITVEEGLFRKVEMTAL
jgi:TolB protein